MTKHSVPSANASSRQSAPAASAANAVAEKVRQKLAAFRSSAAVPKDAVEIARVMGAWGVKGGLKLHPFSAEADALLAAKRWLVLPSERGAKVFEGALDIAVDRVRAHSDSFVAQLKDVDDRDVAEALKGARIFVLRQDFPAVDGEDEFYWVDLIGLSVVNREGVLLGQVKELISNGPQSVLVLAADAALGLSSEPIESDELGDAAPAPVEAVPADKAAAKAKAKATAKKAAAAAPEILIPFVDAFIDSVKLKEQTILVDWQPDF